VPVIDLSFAVRGTTIPLDYGYALFSALSRVVPGLHGDRRVGVHPIRGVRLRPRLLTLVPQSRLRLRIPSEEIAPYLALAGARLDLEGAGLSVGMPRAESLRPAASLASRLVTIGHLTEPGPFLESIRRQLTSLGVAAEPSLVPDPSPARAGEPTRRILRIKGRRIVGFGLRIDGLTAEESLVVQENGLGSRRRMGCGVFVPDPGKRTDG
jgi:CRISPR-associated protein Cas6